MPRVNYEKVAETYDELEVRREVPTDDVIGELVARREGTVRVLDVGCGTGAYLAAQHRAFGSRVELSGMDPSEGMLARARAKLPNTLLKRASAESIPFADRSFDFVGTRFAFHHFEDKPRALREMRRVLAPDGVLFVTNIAPERMPGWWLFTLFPEATADNARYWPVERIVGEVETLGFDVSWEAPTVRTQVPLREALAQAEKRDQSHLFVMDDATFERRLREVEARVAREPNAGIESEVSVLRLIGRPRG